MRATSDSLLHKAISWLLVALTVAVGILLYVVAHAQAERAATMRIAFNTVADNPNPVIICENGVIRLVNAAAELMLNQKAVDLINQPCSNIVPEIFRNAHNDSIEKLKKLPVGSTGVRHYLLPPEHGGYAVTINFRVESVDSVMMVARFLDYRQDTAWRDVETGKLFRMHTEFKPTTKATN